MWEPIEIARVGARQAPPATPDCARTSPCGGGLDVPLFHGSARTFTLGGFGGVTGSACDRRRAGGYAPESDTSTAPARVRTTCAPN